MITSANIKQKAREYGADLVKIASIERFEGTTPEHDPRFIAPAAKSVIGIGMRVLRGSLRGIESGTQFYQFPTMGIQSIDVRFAPHVLRRLACFIEDHGFEGVAQMRTDRRHISDKGIDPEMEETHRFDADPVAPGKPAPDVIMDFEQAAYLCGFGEMGMGGFFLTPEFGPFQRFAYILTDLELEPDPIGDNIICDQCGKCIDGCPGNAILADKKTTKLWGGRKLEFNTLDEWQCAAYYAGAWSPGNPFLPPDAYQDIPDGAKIAEGKKQLSPEEVNTVRRMVGEYYPGIGLNYSACMCGKACQRECYIHLQEKGVLTKKFKNPFRTEKTWSIENKSAKPNRHLK